MQTLRISMLALAVAAACAQDTKYPPEWQQIPGPPSKADTADWLKDVRRWREEERVRAGLSEETYDNPATAWAASSFMQPQVMVEDRYLYDPAQRRYTVDRLLNDFEARYGGIDSILLWPVYPNIGIDDRNQFDMLRSMPGGLAALKAMVADFHRRGVRVLFPNMPWDTGTRPEPLSKPETIAKLLAEIGADGVNGDTFAGMPRTYLLASLNAGHPLALEPELYPAGDETLNWNVMSWGYWKYPFVPMISKAKWLEPRHMVNVCDRWNRDKTDNLQAAFFNGAGFETWENVWGIWNGITERDAEAIRRVAAIERAFPALLTSAEWEPHTPTVQYGVFASRFPGAGPRLVDAGESDGSERRRSATGDRRRAGYALFRSVAWRGVASRRGEPFRGALLRDGGAWLRLDPRAARGARRGVDRVAGEDEGTGGPFAVIVSAHLAFPAAEARLGRSNSAGFVRAGRHGGDSGRARVRVHGVGRGD